MKRWYWTWNLLPTEPDANTQLRVEIILSKNVFLDENTTWNSEKEALYITYFLKMRQQLN